MAKKSGLVLLVLAILVSSVFAAPKKNKNKGLVDPARKFHGLSYGEWEARWWQAAFDLPIIEGDHPLISGGAFGGDDDVVFLAAPVGREDIVEVTVNKRTALFIPILNFECSVAEPEPFHGDDEASLRECANTHADNTSDVFAYIDGEKVRGIEDFRVESPLFQWGPLPEDNLLSFFGVDAPEGTTSDAVDAGYYLLVEPLKEGRHLVEIGGTLGGELSGFVHTIFIINVEKQPKH